MASHIDSHLDKKTTGKPRGGRKVIAPVPDTIPSTLDAAVAAQRTPTTGELLEECKVVLGRVLIGLRGSDNIYKASTAISNIVKAIATVSAAERVEEVSDEILTNMTIDELKVYTSKMLDRLN